MKLLKIFLSFYLVINVLSGCVAYNAMPVAARPGDTITLGIGSADGISTSNTTVTYLPDAGSPVPLTDFHVFKLYPDKTSSTLANPANSTWEITATSGHEPWLTVMAINLPTTGLVPGAGVVEISTTADYPTISNHVNDVPISLEILAGTGSPHPLEYNIGLGASATGKFSSLERTHQVIVKPPFDELATWPTYGAIEVTLRFAADGAPPSSFQIVSDDISLYTGSDRNVIHKVSGDELIVSYISPTGLLNYYEPRFSVVPLKAKPLSTPPPLTMPSEPPTVKSVVYYDVDGVVATGPSESEYTVFME